MSIFRGMTKTATVSFRTYGPIMSYRFKNKDWWDKVRDKLCTVIEDSYVQEVYAGTPDINRLEARRKELQDEILLFERKLSAVKTDYELNEDNLKRLRKEYKEQNSEEARAKMKAQIVSHYKNQMLQRALPKDVHDALSFRPLRDEYDSKFGEYEFSFEDIIQEVYSS